MALDNLSERDRAVLRSIFDPTATIGDVADDGDSFSEEQDILFIPEDSLAPQIEEYKSLCLRGVQLAEAGQHHEALQLLSRAVQTAPEASAAYNDRAQLYRLMKRDDDAIADISKVLQVTEGKATRARALALCQKGVLLRKRGEDDEARALFIEAAKLGSGFAKKQVVELNPYAALCNQMLSQVMKGENEIKL